MHDINMRFLAAAFCTTACTSGGRTESTKDLSLISTSSDATSTGSTASNEAGRAGERLKRIYCRALASHLEREATELAHIKGVATAAGEVTAPEQAGTFLGRRGQVTVADAVVVGAMASMITLIWHYIV